MVPSNNHSNCSDSVPGKSRNQTPTPLLTVAVRGCGVLVAVGRGVAVAVGSGEVGPGSDVETDLVAVGTSVAAGKGDLVSGGGVAVGDGAISSMRKLTPMTAKNIKASRHE
jgi:hypothetical protein